MAGRSGLLALCTTIGLVFAAGPAPAADRVVFGTNWLAEAEHGGFYQALAAGIYARHGLEVEIRPGGPQVNHSQLLAAGVVDVAMIANNATAINFLTAGIPVVTVAAFFQKDPAVLVAHPDQGNDSIAALKGKPIMISAESREGWWRFLKLRFGFDDGQIRPYNFQMAPFLADKRAVQQAYVTAEPYEIERLGVKPRLLLLADNGWPAYSTLTAVPKRLIAEKPDVVRRFVEASIEGWYAYLYGDSAPANARIKRDNPEMTDGQIAYSIAKMKEYGIVDSGDTATLGIGAMTEPKLKQFFDLMVDSGLYGKELKFMDAFDARFVNKGHGLSMRPR
jgi:NitT/TauT family transport system substrate-binding protein